MSRELRLCPGVRGQKCGAFLSSWDRDPHPTCTRCRGRICTRDMTCDFCVGWSPSQWEAFAKKHSYKERKCSSRPSGSPPLPLRRRLLLVRGLLRKSCALRPLPLLLPSLQEGRLRVEGSLGMHLVLCPVRLPLLLLNLGPARGVEVSLVARLVRASALLPTRILRELGRGRLLIRSGRPLPAPLPRLPLPAHHSTLCDVVSRESLRKSAPVLDPPMFPDLRVEEQGRIVGPALGRPALVTGPIVPALALLPARGRERRRRASFRSLSTCERLRSLGRSRSRRVCSRSRGDRSRSSDRYLFCRDRFRRERSWSSDRYRSRRQRSRSPAQRGDRHDRSRSRDTPIRSRDARAHVSGHLPPLAARSQRREDDKPEVRSRRLWRR